MGLQLNQGCECANILALWGLLFVCGFLPGAERWAGVWGRGREGAVAGDSRRLFVGCGCAAPFSSVKI